MLEAFEVPPKDWDDTKKYFAQSDTLVKFPRKDSNKNILRKFSFIRVNKEIYAVGNKQYIIGEGNFGVVRLGQTEDKHPYAIKVEGGELLGSRPSAIAVMKKINYLIGQTIRHLEKPKDFKQHFTDKKLYSVMRLIEGKELFDVILDHENGINPLSDIQQLEIAKKACEAVSFLHQLKIIHADIKTENFKVFFTGQWVVQLVDFDFSFLLDDNKTITLKNRVFQQLESKRGTEGYAAPEILKSRLYSYYSDIYALGITLQYFPVISDFLSDMVKKMTEENPLKRIELKEVILQIDSLLKQKLLVKGEAKKETSPFALEQSRSLIFTQLNKAKRKNKNTPAIRQVNHSLKKMVLSA